MSLLRGQWQLPSEMETVPEEKAIEGLVGLTHKYLRRASFLQGLVKRHGCQRYAIYASWMALKAGGHLSSVTKEQHVALKVIGRDTQPHAIGFEARKWCVFWEARVIGIDQDGLAVSSDPLSAVGVKLVDVVHGDGSGSVWPPIP